MDCNSDVQNTEIQTWITSLELSEGITGRQIIPSDISTYQRGRFLIDGVFVSHSITIKNSPYLPFEYLTSDYRRLWIDIDF